MLDRRLPKTVATAETPMLLTDDLFATSIS